MINGRVNLGLVGPAYYSLIFPFINILKQANDIEIFTTFARSTSWPAGNGNSAWPFLDADGEMTNPLDASVNNYTRILYSPGADGLPDGVNWASQQWIVKWATGTATCQMSGTGGQSQNGRRVTFTWGAMTNNKQFSFSSIDHNNPPRDIVVCRADLEALYDAGEVFDPTWLTEIRRASGILRFMDWQFTNSNRITLTFADMQRSSSYSWCSLSSDIAGNRGGMPASVMVAVANRAQSHPWINIPMHFGCAKVWQLSAVSKASPAVGTTIGTHTFQAGDEVIVYGTASGMTQAATVTLTIATPCVVTWSSSPVQNGNPIRLTGGTFPTGITANKVVYAKNVSGDTFEISATPGGASINTTGSQSGTHTGTLSLRDFGAYTVANPGSNTLEFAGLDSTNFATYGGSGLWVCLKTDLDAIEDEVALLAAYVRDNLIAFLTGLYEFGNEMWNAQFYGFHLNRARAYLRYGDDVPHRVQGHLAAHCMKVIRDAYGVDNRSKWKGILAAQYGNLTVVDDMLTGINDYITEFSLGLSVDDLFDHIAITNYWAGNLFTSSNKTTILQRMADSESRWIAGLEPTKYEYFNRITGPLEVANARTVSDSTIGIGVNPWPLHKVRADANGLTLIAYEGGADSSPNLSLLGALTSPQRTTFMEFYKQYCHSSYQAEAFTTNFEATWTNSGAYPAKFVEGGPVTTNGCFGGIRYVGDSNAVWDAVKDFNRNGQTFRCRIRVF